VAGSRRVDHEAGREPASLWKKASQSAFRDPQRNADRFPKDFMFQLTQPEPEVLRRQFGTLKTGRGKPFFLIRPSAFCLSRLTSSPATP
jgi:ORF6N domain